MGRPSPQKNDRVCPRKKPEDSKQAAKFDEQWTDKARFRQEKNGCFISNRQGLVNVPIKHHPTIGDIISNRYFKVIFKIPKKGHLPTPVLQNPFVYSLLLLKIRCFVWIIGLAWPFLLHHTVIPGTNSWPSARRGAASSSETLW